MIDEMKKFEIFNQSLRINNLVLHINYSFEKTRLDSLLTLGPLNEKTDIDQESFLIQSEFKPKFLSLLK